MQDSTVLRSRDDFTIFSHFASVADCGCEFHIGTLRSNFKHYKSWPYLNFQLKQQIKVVLTGKVVNPSTTKYTHVGQRVSVVFYITVHHTNGPHICNGSTQLWQTEACVRKVIYFASYPLGINHHKYIFWSFMPRKIRFYWIHNVKFKSISTLQQVTFYE